MDQEKGILRVLNIWKDWLVQCFEEYEVVYWRVILVNFFCILLLELDVWKICIIDVIKSFSCLVFLILYE